MGPLQAQNESNIHAKSNMGAKCVWASSMVFEEKMGQAKSKEGKKKKQLVLCIAWVTLMCTYNVEKANFEQ